jgi:hypothetical protein
VFDSHCLESCTGLKVVSRGDRDVSETSKKCSLSKGVLGGLLLREFRAVKRGMTEHYKTLGHELELNYLQPQSVSLRSSCWVYQESAS